MAPAVTTAANQAPAQAHRQGTSLAAALTVGAVERSRTLRGVFATSTTLSDEANSMGAKGIGMMCIPFSDVAGLSPML